MPEEHEIIRLKKRCCPWRARNQRTMLNQPDYRHEDSRRAAGLSVQGIVFKLLTLL